MQLKTITYPGLSINTYLLIDSHTRQAAVVDPVRNIHPLLEVISKEKCEVAFILETHVHADFVSGAKELKHHYKNKPQILCSGEGGKEWSPLYADRLVNNQDIMILGAIQLQAWHVPGHTPEHLMWIATEGDSCLAFTGDFLLRGAVGRPDLLGRGNVLELAEKLYASVFNVLPLLPGHAVILPAHGAGSFCAKGISDKGSSTLAEEWKTNPSLQKEQKDLWIKNLLHLMPHIPAYFPYLKQLNVKGAPLLSSHKSPHPIAQGDFIIDLRQPEAFAARHLKGALNFPFGPSLVKWVGEIVPFDQPIILAGDDLSLIKQASEALKVIGLDKIEGYILEDANLVGAFKLLSPQTAYESQELVLDVRTQEEWEQGHIPNAIHIPLHQLEHRIDEIPKNQPIIVNCGSGYRSSIGVSILLKVGFSEVSGLRGGIEAWKKSKLPLDYPSKAKD